MFISKIKQIKTGVAPTSGKAWTLYEVEDGDGKTYGTFLKLQEGNEYQVEIQPSEKVKPTIEKARASNSNSATSLSKPVGYAVFTKEDGEAIWQELRYLREKVDEILSNLRMK